MAIGTDGKDDRGRSLVEVAALAPAADWEVSSGAGAGNLAPAGAIDWSAEPTTQDWSAEPTGTTGGKWVLVVLLGGRWSKKDALSSRHAYEYLYCKYAYAPHLLISKFRGRTST